MATTGCNFVKVGSTRLLSAAVTSAPYVAAKHPAAAAELEADSGGTVADRAVFDLALTAVPTVGTQSPSAVKRGKYIGAYAKNGSVLLSLSGTTPQTIDLTDLTANTPASYAGDTGFAKVDAIIFANLDTGGAVVTTGATTPASLPKFNGTSAGLTVAANSVVAVHSNADVTVDSTHKLIVVTPAATTTMVVSIGGS